MNQYEWRIMGLWAIAILATAILVGQQGALILGTVFFGCMIGSLLALRQAAAHHVEWIMVALWILATGAMLVVTADSQTGNILGPLYFVCLVGSVLTVRKARMARA